MTPHRWTAAELQPDTRPWWVGWARLAAALFTIGAWALVGWIVSALITAGA